MLLNYTRPNLGRGGVGWGHPILCPPLFPCHCPSLGGWGEATTPHQGTQQELFIMTLARASPAHIIVEKDKKKPPPQGTG